MALSGVIRIKPPGPEQGTILDESNGSITHECCQQSHCSHHHQEQYSENWDLLSPNGRRLHSHANHCANLLFVTPATEPVVDVPLARIRSGERFPYRPAYSFTEPTYYDFR